MFKRFSDHFSSSELRACLALLAVLVAMTLVPPAFFRYHPREDTTVKKIFRTVQKRGTNRDAAAQQTAGYYEGLLDGAAGVAGIGGAGGKGWLNWQFWLVERKQVGDRVSAIRRARPDFLRYDLQPGVDVTLPGQPRIVINSLGMTDREYAVAAPPDTWRIALVGDSVSQGTAAGHGLNFESLLEAHLNMRHGGKVHANYEILNFSIQGYQITQFVDVALHRAPALAPDVYVVALTVRSVHRSWADHLASLVRNNVDLKYDFLRQAVREARVSSNMSEGLINARLSRHRLPIMRWALTEIQAHARRANVPLVVMLVPIPDDTELQMEEFDGIQDILDDLQIPSVDLLETFAYVEDLRPVRVSDGDRHPNEKGHRMLFEAIAQRLGRDAAFERTLAGLEVVEGTDRVAAR
jgi:hypothetical protein